jgi:hypothetical protein
MAGPQSHDKFLDWWELGREETPFHIPTCNLYFSERTPMQPSQMVHAAYSFFSDSPWNPYLVCSISSGIEESQNIFSCKLFEIEGKLITGCD